MAWIGWPVAEISSFEIFLMRGRSSVVRSVAGWSSIYKPRKPLCLFRPELLIQIHVVIVRPLFIVNIDWFAVCHFSSCCEPDDGTHVCNVTVIDVVGLPECRVQLRHEEGRSGLRGDVNERSWVQRLGRHHRLRRRHCRSPQHQRRPG